MYRKQLSPQEKAEREQQRDAELAQWGMTRADAADQIAADEAAENVDVFPDCWPAIAVFADLRTQWRVGGAGLYALDYTAIPVVMDFHGIKDEDRGDMFADLRVMEVAALETIRGSA